MDQRQIVEKPFVVVNLIELSELRSELPHRRLEVGEPRGKLPELVKEEEGFLDARTVLREGQEHGELQREFRRLATEREVEARQVEALLLPIPDLVEVDPLGVGEVHVVDVGLQRHVDQSESAEGERFGVSANVRRPYEDHEQSNHAEQRATSFHDSSLEKRMALAMLPFLILPL